MVYARGSVVSAIITDSRVATIGTSVRIKRQKRHVLGVESVESVVEGKELVA
jgi:hypothetical protein